MVGSLITKYKAHCEYGYDNPVLVYYFTVRGDLVDVVSYIH